MPTFKSIGGEWVPATEETVIKQPQPDGSVKLEIYRGPDREAERYIKENGGTVGTKIEEDPMLIEIAESRRMTVQQYIAKNTPTPVQQKEKQDADNKVVTHQDPLPKEGVSPTLGGFSAEGVAPEEALAEKKRGRPRA